MEVTCDNATMMAMKPGATRWVRHKGVCEWAKCSEGMRSVSMIIVRVD